MAEGPIQFLTTGSLPLVPPIPGADLENVFSIKKDVAYLTHLLEVLKEARDVVVIGGGFSGGDTVGELVNLIAAMIQAEMNADQIVTFQMGTHPLPTASPVAYQVVNAVEIALRKMR